MARSIEIEGLVVTRGDFTLAVDALSIRKREVFALLGETGAGKTMLLEAIAGAYPLEHGRILFDGKDAANIPPQRRGLGILYQDCALFPHMTVRENIGYGLKMRGVPRDEIRARVDEQLRAFRIEKIADRFPGVISGGESQRAALARALVMQPELLLLDEPFSALDPATKRRLYQLIDEIHARFDCTIVFVTHDFNEAIRLADRVGVVLSGRLRAVMPADDLLEGECSAEVAAFLGRDISH